ncbi:MAG: hypothetical protein R3229_18770, partial [Alphaproteobacteria bacterium]|nr:hypothetical protein [Alphaproteobacteria bacterium]
MFVMLGVVFGLMHGNLDSVHPYDVARPLLVLSLISIVATLLLFALHRPLGRIFPAALYLYFSSYEINVFSEKYGVPDALSVTAVLLLLVALYFLFRYVDGLRASQYAFVATLAMAT